MPTNRREYDHGAQRTARTGTFPVSRKRRTGFRFVLVAGGLLLALTASQALAESTIRFDVMVSQISQTPGPIDPRAAKLHEKIRNEFRYESLRVLESKTMNLGIDDVGTLRLPNGKQLGLKPLLIDDRGVLLSVDLEGTLQGDLRVKNGHQVVIGAQRVADGKLVISLEPRF